MVEPMSVAGLVFALVGTMVNIGALGWSIRNIQPSRYEDFPASLSHGHTPELIKLLADFQKVDQAHVVGSVLVVLGGILTLAAEIR